MYENLHEPQSTMAPEHIQSKNIVTENIVLDDELIEKLSHDYLDPSVNHIPSSYALYESLLKLGSDISAIDPNNRLFTDISALSLPLMPLSFKGEHKTLYESTLQEVDPDHDTGGPYLNCTNDKEWIYKNWWIDDGRIIYTNHLSTITTLVDDNNHIRIRPEILSRHSYYFLNIEIERLDSGELQVIEDLSNNTTSVGANVNIVAKFDAKVTPEAPINNRKFYALYFHDNESAISLRLRAINVLPNESIIIRSIGVHRVTQRLYDYIEFMKQQLKKSYYDKEIIFVDHVPTEDEVEVYNDRIFVHIL